MTPQPFLAKTFLQTRDGQRYQQFIDGLHTAVVDFESDSEDIPNDSVAKIILDRTPLVESNSVGSLYSFEKHKPVLDLDMDVLVVPSTTPGHHHLYIDQAMSWKDYSLLMCPVT